MPRRYPRTAGALLYPYLTGMKVNRALRMDGPYVKHLWHRIYSDGPLDGLIEYKGEKLWYKMQRENASGNSRIFCAYRLKPEMLAEVEAKHADKSIPDTNQYPDLSCAQLVGWFRDLPWTYAVPILFKPLSLLDTVEVTEPFPNVPKGSRGVVVQKFPDDWYEIQIGDEFDALLIKAHRSTLWLVHRPGTKEKPCSDGSVN